VFQKKTPTHIIGYKLRNSACLILIIFDVKLCLFCVVLSTSMVNKDVYIYTHVRQTLLLYIVLFFLLLPFMVNKDYKYIMYSSKHNGSSRWLLKTVVSTVSENLMPKVRNL